MYIPDSVQRLEIWRDGMDLAHRVYSVSAAWPRQEDCGLAAQARRAAVSIPANIAEGVGRGSPAEGARFAQISLGSVYELHTLMELAGRRGLLGSDELTALSQELSLLARRISTFIRYKRHRAPRP